jgi:hypothetical protein
MKNEEKIARVFSIFGIILIIISIFYGIEIKKEIIRINGIGYIFVTGLIFAIIADMLLERENETKSF